MQSVKFLFLLYFISGFVYAQQTEHKIVIENPEKRSLSVEKIPLGKLILKETADNDVFKTIKKTLVSYTDDVKNKKRQKLSFSNVTSRPVYRIMTPEKSHLNEFRGIDNSSLGLKKLDISSGLPSNDINNVVQTANGDVWIASSGFLAKLKTGTAEIYSVANGLLDYTVSDMVEYNGSLFIATYGGGLLEYQNNSVRIHHVKSGFVSDYVLDLEIYQGKLYIATHGKGLVRLNESGVFQVLENSFFKETGKIITSMSSNTSKLYVCAAEGLLMIENDSCYQLDKSSGLNVKNANNVLINPAGDELWITNNEGKLYHLQHNKLELFELTEKASVLFLGKSGNIWVGTNEGLICLVDDYTSYFKVWTKDGLNSQTIRSLYQDSFNNLWICSNNQGLFLLSPSNFKNLEAGNTKISTLCIGPESQLVYENQDGGGLVFNEQGKLTVYRNEYLKNLSDLKYDSSTGSYWAITPSGLLEITRDKTIIKQRIFHHEAGNIGDLIGLTIHKDGTLYVSTCNYGLMVLRDKVVYFYPQWYDINGVLDYSNTIGSEGKVYACSAAGRLGVFENNRITIYTLKDKISNTKIYNALELKKDCVIVGTNKGLYVLNKGLVSKLNLKPVLNEKRIVSVYFGADGTLWLGTNTGLFSYKQSVLKYYNNVFGLVSSVFNRNSVVGNSKGNIFWTTPNGIIQYSPFKFTPLEKARKITIDQVNINDHGLVAKELNDKKIKISAMKDGIPVGLSLPSEYNNIQILINSNSWGKESLTELYYKLNNKKDWVPLNKEGNLQLYNLPSGAYDIRFLGMFPDSPPAYASFSFEISHPFYQRLWFILLCSSFLIVSILVLFKRIRSYDFDKVETYSETRFLIRKIRVLSVVSIVVLIVIDYFYSELTDVYRVYWPANIIISVIVAGIYIYSFSKNPSVRLLNTSVKVIFTVMCVFYFFKAYFNVFSPIISIESCVCVLFVILVLKDYKNIIIFSLIILIAGSVMIYLSPAATDNKSLFISALLQALLAVHIFTLLEAQKLTKTLFSEKVLKGSSQFVLVSDINGKIVYVNEYLQRILNKREEELLGDGWWKLKGWNDDKIDEFKKQLMDNIKNERSEKYTNEFEINNQTLFIKWQDTPIEGKYMMGIGEDVTMERLAEKRIRESENNFRLLNETIDDVFWLIDLQTHKIVYISPSCVNMFERTPEDYYTDPTQWIQYVVPEDHPIILRSHQIISEKGNYDIEFRINLNGKLKWIREKSFLIVDDQGVPVKSSGISSDITSLKITEQEIKRLSLVAEKTSNGVTIADETGNILWANQSYLDMFEISMENLINKRPKDLFSSHDSELGDKLEVLNSSRSSYSLEIEALTFTKKPIWIELYNTTIRNEHGVPIQVEVINNITQRKEADKLIRSKNEDILSSIRYAQRIQNALFTSNDFFNNLPLNPFLYYKPKDIVGGDFYWAEKVGNDVIIAIGDCTGHGVPGSLMTSLGINGLVNAVKEQHITDPESILDYLDGYIKSILSVNNGEQTINDGMEIGIINFNTLTNEVRYSGSGRPLVIIEGETVTKIKGSRSTVGSKIASQPFTSEQFILREGMILYLFSDGIVDQFHALTNKKLGSKSLQKFLISIQQLSMPEKEQAFISFINDHCRNEEQTDDMVLLALELKPRSPL